VVFSSHNDSSSLWLLFVESKGFEPLEPVKVRQFSKLVLSTTQPTLHIHFEQSERSNKFVHLFSISQKLNNENFLIKFGIGVNGPQGLFTPLSQLSFIYIRGDGEIRSGVLIFINKNIGSRPWLA
jgi:hypothetical protein